MPAQKEPVELTALNLLPVRAGPTPLHLTAYGAHHLFSDIKFEGKSIRFVFVIHSYKWHQQHFGF